jgi:hypothetical protein
MCLALVNSYIRPRAELLAVILAELLPPETEIADRQLIAFSIVGQCLFHRVHRRIALLVAGEEMYQSWETGRLADHIARFSLAALGRAAPVTAGCNGSVASCE